MFDKTLEIISELLKSWDGKMLLVSVGLLLITFLVAGVQILGLVRYKRARFWTIPRCLAIGIFLSTACYLFSYYYFLRDNGPLQSVLHTFWHTLQLFVLDGDAGNLAEVFKDTCENPLYGSDIVQNEYIFFASVIRILAPLTTFAFLLTFVKNIYAHILYFFRKPWTDTHVFSELNEKSLALAENLKNYPLAEGNPDGKHWVWAKKFIEKTKQKKAEWKEKGKTNQTKEKKEWLCKTWRLRGRCVVNFFVKLLYFAANWFMRPTIVFTDVTDKREEENLEWVDKAKEIGAILFRKDLEAIPHRRIIQAKRQCIYLISEDESEKVRHTINIIDRWKNLANVRLYVFSDKVESKAMLDSHTKKEREKMRMRVIRVNDARALIYHNLDVAQEKATLPVREQSGKYIKSNTTGMRLFENAIKVDEKNRRISAVVVGLGRYGMEMLKVLLWYCQLPGYEIKITALDEAEDIKSRIQAMCPEIILDVPYTTPGDMRYEVHVKSVKVGTKEFCEELERVKDVTYVFVGLGRDDLNLSTVSIVENHMIALGRTPDIDTIVYNADLADQMREKWKETASSSLCRVQIIGDLKNFYSAGTVILSDLEEEAFEIHMRWCGKDMDKMSKRQKRRYEEKVRQQFHMQDYDYFSSLASALHRRLRKKIVQYSADDVYCRNIFPMFRKANENDSSEETYKRELLHTELTKIGTSQDAQALSDEMKRYENCMNAKLGHMFYQVLNDEEKANVRVRLLEKLQENQDTTPEEFLLAEKIASDEAYAVFVARYKELDKPEQRAMALVKTCVVEMAIESKVQSSSSSPTDVRSLMLQYEYDALTPKLQKDVATYVLEHKSDERPFDEFRLCVKSVSYLEHIRWNAYMRTEGVRLSVMKDNAHKLHPLIVPAEQLTLEEKIKDI